MLATTFQPTNTQSNNLKQRFGSSKTSFFLILMLLSNFSYALDPDELKERLRNFWDNFKKGIEKDETRRFLVYDFYNQSELAILERDLPVKENYWIEICNFETIEKKKNELEIGFRINLGLTFEETFIFGKKIGKETKKIEPKISHHEYKFLKKLNPSSLSDLSKPSQEIAKKRIEIYETEQNSKLKKEKKKKEKSANKSEILGYFKKFFIFEEGVTYVFKSMKKRDAENCKVLNLEYDNAFNQYLMNSITNKGKIFILRVNFNE